MASPAVSRLCRPCICEICDCGRHQCPHITRPYEMNEKPCLLTEYTDKYLLYPNTGPRESCKPVVEYNKQPVPMEGISTMRRDYVPHEVSPIKLRPPEQYFKSNAAMDLLSTYKQDYNPYPIKRVPPCVPQERKYSTDDRMTAVPTYKADYLPWKQAKRDMIKPANTFRPAEDKFDSRTTHQDEYLYKGPVITKSCKPFRSPHITKIPLDSMTNYKLNYVAHPMSKRHAHVPEPFKPCSEPFDGLTTHKQSYKGLAGPPAQSVKPPYVRPDLSSFVGTTEFREKFLAWPTAPPFSRKPPAYIPPKEKMDLKTMAQLHYVDPHGRPATSCKPVACVVTHTDPFNHCSTMKEDYKHWDYSKPKAIVPNSEVTLPKVPMDTLTTFQSHYTPHPLPFTKSFKPRLPAARPHVPFVDETTYATCYTPKKVHICPATYKEPPGYVFEKIDEGGHRRFRPATVAQDRCASSLNIGDRRSSLPGGSLSQTGLKEVAMKA
nr:stabilizer of axonemal microtubules 1 [Zootoca vivipara]